MHNQTITQLAQGLRKKDFSCLELTSHFLQRIKNFNNKLNCFITDNEEQALLQAKQLDSLIAKKNTPSPICGVPVAFKDNIYTHNTKTTCASKMLQDFIAPYDATLVEKLKHAGCIVLGKTNMDEFAMGATCENSYYGPTKNPWHLDKIPGGSSGGSAAAVAARLAPISLGTDTGGSVRQPSALCGVTGLKPTYGLISRHGIVPFAPSLDQAGILAQTAEDIALLLQHCTGQDPQDPATLLTTSTNYCQNLTNPLAGLKIGIPQECLLHLHNQDNRLKAQLYNDAIKALENLGIKISPISLPHLSCAIPTYYAIATAECTTSLAKYNGAKNRSEAFGAEVKHRLLIGAYVQQNHNNYNHENNETLYIKAQKVRQLIKNDFISAWQNVDIILTPTTPIDACFIGEKTTNPHHPINHFLSDIYTSPANLAGLPAISLPIGFVDNMPLGLQLIGPYLSEAQLLNITNQYQKITPWHSYTPL
jgi:aspartyl-tRNA(Asn)/glutamyl-tRNA(Gln) amidotransferase subunit A